MLKMPPGLKLLRAEIFVGVTSDGKPIVQMIHPDNVVHMDPANQVIITTERVETAPATADAPAEDAVHTSQWHGFPFVLVSEPTMVVVPE